MNFIELIENSAMVKNEENKLKSSFPEDVSRKPADYTKQQHAEPSPLDALTALNAVAALAVAQQGQHSVFPNHLSHEQFLANPGNTPRSTPPPIIPGTSKHLMQFMSSVAPTAASAYQRSYLEAFRFYKAAYGANLHNPVNNS